MKRYALIGPMGSGKSALAKRIAARFGGTVIDTDAEFTRRYGDISAFFVERGEAEFRKLEQNLMIEAAQSNYSVVSLGGGAALNKRGMNALRATCDIVRLTAPTDVLKSRIAKSNRPLKNSLEKTLVERETLYVKYADYTVDSSVDSFAEFTQAIRNPRGNRYDILLCDSDNTLLDFTKASEYSVRRTVEELMPDLSVADEAVRAFADATDILWAKIERGEITRDELLAERVRMVGERINKKLDTAIFSSTYAKYMCATEFTVDGAIEFLDELRARGIRAYVITNGFAFVAKSRTVLLAPHTDGCFISEEVGAYKPSHEFFDRVLTQIGKNERVDKDRILVFGDSESSDVAGGINAGLDTCLFAPRGSKPTAADYCVTSFGQLLDII